MRRLLAVAVLALLGSVPGKEIPQFTDWLTAENLGPVINGPYTDTCVAISKNGLSLFFSSTRQTGNPGPTETNRDLYVSHRETTDAAWGEPQPLSMLNTPAWDSCPALSLDEHRLYFTSARPGGCGDRDIWVSQRPNRRDDFGWGAPVNLGCEKDGYVNTPQTEVFPTFFEDETGKVLMYFGRSVGSSMDLFQTEMRDDDTFGPATPIVELNTAAIEHSVTVRRDGLEVFFGSNRGGGPLRFWTATRASTSDPWSTPVLVSSLTISPSGRFAMSFDGRELYFASTNPPSYGGVDIWVARRERLR